MIEDRLGDLNEKLMKRKPYQDNDQQIFSYTKNEFILLENVEKVVERNVDPALFDSKDLLSLDPVNWKEWQASFELIRTGKALKVFAIKDKGGIWHMIDKDDYHRIRVLIGDRVRTPEKVAEHVQEVENVKNVIAEVGFKGGTVDEVPKTD